MKYFFALIPVFLLGTLYLAGQEQRIKVTDSISGEPVPFASVRYAGGAGVITNEEGYFQLPDASAMKSEILISCLGYQNKTVPVKVLRSGTTVIKLQEAVVELDGVFLSNRVPDAQEIMEKVRNRIGANYKSELKVHQVFSRQTDYADFEKMNVEVTRASGVSRDAVSRSNDELDSLAAVILKNRSVHFRDYLGELYLRDEKNTKLKVEKVSSLTDHKNEFSPEKLQHKAQAIVLQYLDTTQSYKLKTGILKIEDSLELGNEFTESDSPKEYKVSTLRKSTQNLLNSAHFHDNSFLLGLVEPRAYEFRFSKATFLNDELIYIIDYLPARGSSKFTGKIFVNGNDFAIVKVNYKYAEGKRGDKLNLKLLFGIKYIEDTRNGTILFKKASWGTYEPSYVQQTTGSYFFIKRPLKLIENSTEKNKVKFNFTIEGKNRAKEELLLTSTRDMQPSEFESLEENENVNVLKLQKYEETLWEKEETLQPLEEMRQFNAMQ
jgi:hypothetical protein